MSPPSNRSRNRPQGKLNQGRNRNSGGQVRIIAGQWRGRKLAVADVAGLRPTGDRVRETLFNWLQMNIAGSHCLDLFAGSGALGFEALSRFAASVTFIEPDRLAFQTLQHSASELGQEAQEKAHLIQSTAEKFLVSSRQQFDIIFIDPPFGASMQWDIVNLLEENIAPNAWIYVEAPSNQALPEVLPYELLVNKEKQFGDVHARLLSRSRIK